MKKIAALIPAFNAARTISVAVESMLWQEVPAGCSYEVGVLDDGSTDETSAVLERISAGPHGSRLRILRNEVNLGVSPSRNRLIEAVDAHYFFVMDADDIALPGRIVAQVAALDAGHDLVGTHVYNFGAMAGERRFDLDRRQHLVMAMIDQRSFCHPAVAFNGKVARIGYRHKLCDYGLLTDVLLAGLDLGNIPQHYLLYRVHGDSLSNSRDPARIAALRQVVCAIRAGYISKLLGIDAATAGRYSDSIESKILRRGQPDDLVALDRLGELVRERLGIGVDFRQI
jgi:glycosyltransferase involved in cell wall biosynthesis